MSSLRHSKSSFLLYNIEESVSESALESAARSAGLGSVHLILGETEAVLRAGSVTPFLSSTAPMRACRCALSGVWSAGLGAQALPAVPNHTDSVLLTAMAAGLPQMMKE